MEYEKLLSKYSVTILLLRTTAALVIKLFMKILVYRPKLVLLCTVKEVQDYIRETDFQFYQNIVGILVPDVLRPIPSE